MAGNHSNHPTGIGSATYKHGMAETKEYRVWQAMLRRCRDPRFKQYADYGGRGILVCQRWLAFEDFFADMGPRPFAGATLERKDNEGNYEPGNVRWASRKEQCRNRRNSHLLTFNGETLTLVEWGERTGLGFSVITCRLKRGWSVELALTVPVRPLNIRTRKCATTSTNQTLSKTP